MQVLAGAPTYMTRDSRAAETFLIRMARWATALEYDAVPGAVRRHAINQIISMWACVYSGWDSDLGPAIERAYPSIDSGNATIVPTGKCASSIQAAMTMSAWSMILDFDDVMLGGHTGHSSVLTPLSLGSFGKYSGRQMLLAQIVANEIAARVNMVCALGSTRGQMATSLHLVASAAARAKLEGLDPDNFANAICFAISYPSQALYPTFLGSDAKALCASQAIRIGMEAIDAVKAGLRAAENPFDGPQGFFAKHARIAVPEFLDGLGEQWHTSTNSFKLQPVSGYLSAAVEAASELAKHPELQWRDIESIDVWSSLFTIGMERHSSPYLRGPHSRVSTLTFSVPFAIASTLVAGKFSPEQLKRTWIEREDVWDLASHVSVHHDVRMTLAALTADIPIGSALQHCGRWQAATFAWRAATLALGHGALWNPDAYRVAIGLFRSANRSRPDLNQSTKSIGARVSVQLKNGLKVEHSIRVPKGFKNGQETEDDANDLRELLRTKFIDAAKNALSPCRASQTLAMLERFDELEPEEVLQLVQLSCVEIPSETYSS